MAKKKKTKTLIPISQQPLGVIQEKIKRVRELRKEIAETQDRLYGEHDQLVEELLPLFIEEDADSFLIQRNLTLGKMKVRLISNFYDHQKAKLKAKTWKSTAMPTFTIN